MTRRCAFALALAAAAACSHRAAPSPVASGAPRWVGTWTSSQQLVEARNMPPAPGLSGRTLRQVVRTSIGGARIRFRFSNTFGDGPLAIASAHVARSLGAGQSAVDTATDRPLTFGGADSVLIPAGAMATSDPLDYPVAPREDLAVTTAIAAAPAALTGHPGSRTTSYIAAGGRVTAPALPGAATTDHWYVLANLDVVAGDGARAVVTLGNSITDGRGSGTNRNDRWPDELATRLEADPRTARVAVLNAGIGGNTILKGGLGPTALSRLDRDVLDQAGVRWVVVLEGVNDIGGARGADSAAMVARDLIAALRRIAAAAHARGLRIYASPILPFGGSFYEGPGHEEARRTVNAFIRTGGAFDAVIDFDAALRDPAHPDRLLPDADSGDHLHPNETGYRMMAAAVDLGLFRE